MTDTLGYTFEQMLALNLAIVESLPDAVVVINETGTVILFNHRAELMFGYGRRAVIGQMVEMLLPEESRASHVGYRERYFAFPATREMAAGISLHGIDDKGKPFHVNIQLVPYTIDGAGKHAIAIVRRTKMPELPKSAAKPPFGSGTVA